MKEGPKITSIIQSEGDLLERKYLTLECCLYNFHISIGRLLNTLDENHGSGSDTNLLNFRYTRAERLREFNNLANKLLLENEKIVEKLGEILDSNKDSSEPVILTKLAVLRGMYKMNILELKQKVEITTGVIEETTVKGYLELAYEIETLFSSADFNPIPEMKQNTFVLAVASFNKACIGLIALGRLPELVEVLISVQEKQLKLELEVKNFTLIVCKVNEAEFNSSLTFEEATQREKYQNYLLLAKQELAGVSLAFPNVNKEIKAFTNMGMFDFAEGFLKKCIENLEKAKSSLILEATPGVECLQQINLSTYALLDSYMQKLAGFCKLYFDLYTSQSDADKLLLERSCFKDKDISVYFENFIKYFDTANLWLETLNTNMQIDNFDERVRRLLNSKILMATWLEDLEVKGAFDNSTTE